MRITFISIMGCTFTHFVSIYGMRPYISLLAAENGANNIIVGLIAALYSIIQVVIALPVSKIIDKYGTRLPITYGSFLLVLSGAGLSIVHNIIFIGFCSFILGLSHGLVLLGLQHSVTSIGSELDRDKYVGIYTFSNSVGMLVGPVIGGYSHYWLGSNLGFLTTMISSVFSIAFVIFIPNSIREKRQDKTFSINQLLANNKILRILLLSSIVLFSTDITINYFPLYGTEIGLSVIEIGKVLSFSSTASMISRLFLGKFSSLYNRENILKYCLIFGGIGLACYSIFTVYNCLLIIAFLSGSFIGLLNPLTMIGAADIAPKGELSKVLALRIMGNFLGQTISPLAFGLLSIIIGLSPIFLVSGIGLVISTLLVSKNTLNSMKT